MDVPILEDCARGCVHAHTCIHNHKSTHAHMYAHIHTHPSACLRTHAQGVGPDIEVPIIEDLRERFIIDSLALYVLRDGCAIEQVCCMHR